MSDSLGLYELIEEFPIVDDSRTVDTGYQVIFEMYQRTNTDAR